MNRFQKEQTVFLMRNQLTINKTKSDVIKVQTDIPGKYLPRQNIFKKKLLEKLRFFELK